MRRGAEIAVCLALATALHAAAWAALATQGGQEGAGDDGADAVTLAAAAPDIAALVAAWETPPRTPPTPPRPDAPRIDAASPAPRSLASDSVPTRTGPAPAPAAPDHDAGPSLNDAPPARPLPAAAALPPEPRPGLQARGTGGGETGGAARQTAGPSLSDAERRTLMAAWGAEIRARVEAEAARGAGRTGPGRSVVRITVTRSGELESARLVGPSGNPALDRAAIAAVSRAGRFPSAPTPLRLARASFDLPIAVRR